MDSLRTSDLLQELTDSETDLLAKIARPRSLRAGEYLFILGDPADHLYIVVQGAVDLCFPIPLGGDTQDVTVESLSVGKTLGWSALVKPYRFTLSCRASEDCEVRALARRDLLELFEGQPRIGYAMLTRVSELVGIRHLKVHALWVRELQRGLEAETAGGRES